MPPGFIEDVTGAGSLIWDQVKTHVATIQVQHVDSFWEWFNAAHKEIEAAYAIGDTRWLDRQLTHRIRGIEPRLNWEIGPYNDPNFTLVISPSTRENIDLATKIVAAAPVIPMWQFLPAKPPKKMTRLSMELTSRLGAEVCADEWLYRLTAYNGCEFFDIEVFSEVPDSIHDGDLFLLTRRLIEGLVGERLYLERFGAVTVYRPTDTRTREKMMPFRLLGEHVSYLLQKPRKDT
jgi:hypothetical protein